MKVEQSVDMSIVLGNKTAFSIACMVDGPAAAKYSRLDK